MDWYFPPTVSLLFALKAQLAVGTIANLLRRIDGRGGGEGREGGREGSTTIMLVSKLSGGT